jgi:hypothetical protein
MNIFALVSNFFSQPEMSNVWQKVIYTIWLFATVITIIVMFTSSDVIWGYVLAIIVMTWIRNVLIGVWK